VCFAGLWMKKALRNNVAESMSQKPICFVNIFGDAGKSRIADGNKKVGRSRSWRYN
jgi:hypothetical protein